MGCRWTIGVLVLAGAGRLISADVRVVDTEVRPRSEREVLARGAFEVANLSHKWFSVFFQVRAGDEALKMPDGTAFLRKWADVFTPESVYPCVRWSECRIGLSLDEIQKAQNLPRGRTVTLQVLCDIWDPDAQAYVASGAPVASPLIVKVDAEGRIASYECFYTVPHAPARADPYGASFPARRCKLALEHLKLRESAAAYRSVVEHGPVVYDWLFRTILDDRGALPILRWSFLAGVGSDQRGFFFEPIQTAEQARELVSLAYPKAAVIPTREAYEAILRRLEGVGAQDTIKTRIPPGYGLAVTEAPGLGWRVRGLFLHVEDLYQAKKGMIAHLDYAVAKDGRLGLAQVECVDADLEFLLDTPGADAWPRLPRFVIPTEEKARILRTAEVHGDQLDPADWPQGSMDR